MGKLGGEMKALAKHCGGSHKTVNDRIHIVQRFDHHLRVLNVHIQRVAQIKVRHIESYIHERLAQGSANARCKMKWPRCALFCNRPGVNRWQSMSG